MIHLDSNNSEIQKIKDKVIVESEKNGLLREDVIGNCNIEERDHAYTYN